MGRDDLAIEVWTECELSVMHAAWRLALDADAPPTRRTQDIYSSS